MILGPGISTKESLAKSSWIQIDNFADEIALKNARVNAPVTSSLGIFESNILGPYCKTFYNRNYVPSLVS